MMTQTDIGIRQSTICNPYWLINVSQWLGAEILYYRCHEVSMNSSFEGLNANVTDLADHGHGLILYYTHESHKTQMILNQLTNIIPVMAYGDAFHFRNIVRFNFEDINLQW